MYQSVKYEGYMNVWVGVKMYTDLYDVGFTYNMSNDILYSFLDSDELVNKLNAVLDDIDMPENVDIVWFTINNIELHMYIHMDCLHTWTFTVSEPSFTYGEDKHGDIEN